MKKLISKIKGLFKKNKTKTKKEEKVKIKPKKKRVIKKTKK